MQFVTVSFYLLKSKFQAVVLYSKRLIPEGQLEK